jgi:hypothetical protein
VDKPQSAAALTFGRSANSIDSVWKLDWNLVHNRHAATGEWACTVEADSLWFSSETGDTRGPLADWQRAR